MIAWSGEYVASLCNTQGGVNYMYLCTIGSDDCWFSVTIIYIVVQWSVACCLLLTLSYLATFTGWTVECRLNDI